MCTLQGLKTKQISSVCGRNILLLYALSIQNALKYTISIQRSQKNFWEGVAPPRPHPLLYTKPQNDTIFTKFDRQHQLQMPPDAGKNYAQSHNMFSTYF